MTWYVEDYEKKTDLIKSSELTSIDNSIFITFKLF